MSMQYCFSITADTLDLIDGLDTIDGVGFEIRLDTFAHPPDPVALRKRTRAPLLATYRTQPHWGTAPVEKREEIGWALRRACLEAGFDLVDLELDEDALRHKIRVVRESGARVVLSHHGGETHDRLDARLESALATEADIVKIIGMGGGSEDFELQRARYQRVRNRSLLHFFMGEEHAASRVLSLVYGAEFTFVTPTVSHAVAPGQLTHELVARCYKPFEVCPQRLKLFAVIGSPIAHSQSPAFHNPLLKAADPDSLFLALPATSEHDLRILRRTFPELQGLAVTKPMKTVAFGVSGSFLGPHAAGLGAVNTLLADASNWKGANTDLSALMELLRGFERSCVVRVLGYGGVGKAAVRASLSLGFRTQVCNRTASRLRNVDSAVETVSWDDRHEEGAAILIQATSVGMVPRVHESPLDFLPDSTEALIETIYSPKETRLMRLAAAKGARLIGGAVLFQAQARIQNGLFLETLGSP